MLHCRAMSRDIVLKEMPLGFSWETFDPFLFCVHHDDAYPPGDERMAPAASLEGRNLGMDFSRKDGWSMYHGRTVPGFPKHPHRGFETVTIARRGWIDHSDSLGATARFGHGDVQWMTAGRGIVHAEMFPLIETDAVNPTELFQIWLNLARADKMVEPHFSILWNWNIPRYRTLDPVGRAVEVAVVAGQLDEYRAPAPPPHSWAARSESAVAIWTIEMAPHAIWTLPAGPAFVNRALYSVRGRQIRVAGRDIDGPRGVRLRPDAEVVIENGDHTAEFLMLQGRPIDESVVQHGPFVMTRAAEISQAVNDFRRTEFGGWRWQSDGPVHTRERGRFAQHADGRVESGG